jgi:adenosine/AMP kinase
MRDRVERERKRRDASVVVLEKDVGRAIIGPPEGDSPLHVHTDSKASGATQGVEVIGRWHV